MPRFSFSQTLCIFHATQNQSLHYISNSYARGKYFTIRTLAPRREQCSGDVSSLSGSLILIQTVIVPAELFAVWKGFGSP